MSKNTLKGAMIAGAVCSMFAAGQAVAGSTAAPSTVKCAGVNSCKGAGSCSGANNSCKGQNSCKGAGWTAAASDKECKDKGGHVMAAADMKMKK